MNKLICLLLIFSLSFPALADFDLLNQGQAAPYTGYLITSDREKKLRMLDKELEICNNINNSYKRLDSFNSENEAILIKRLDLYKNESERLANTLAKNNSDSFWEKTLYFGLGAVLTGFIAYGVVQATKQ